MPLQKCLPVGSFSKTNPPISLVCFLCKRRPHSRLRRKILQKTVGSFGKMTCFDARPPCSHGVPPFRGIHGSETGTLSPCPIRFVGREARRVSRRPVVCWVSHKKKAIIPPPDRLFRLENMPPLYNYRNTMSRRNITIRFRPRHPAW